MWWNDIEGYHKYLKVFQRDRFPALLLLHPTSFRWINLLNINRRSRSKYNLFVFWKLTFFIGTLNHSTCNNFVWKCRFDFSDWHCFFDMTFWRLYFFFSFLTCPVLVGQLWGKTSFKENVFQSEKCFSLNNIISFRNLYFYKVKRLTGWMSCQVPAMPCQKYWFWHDNIQARI